MIAMLVSPTQIMSASPPDFLLFAQHGWADDNRAMLNLSHQLVSNTVPIIAPSLDYVQTWLQITPLIRAVEKIAIQQFANYPEVPWRIIGHSMGGLIWLEVLQRHPEWWGQVHSLVLVGSPVGGADLGRLIDPLQVGIGIAADLGRNRKPIAEKVAAEIATLTIAGDSDGGSDGTVPVECTKFAHAHFVCLPGLSHPVLRNHPTVATTIQQFWQDPLIGETIVIDHVIRHLQTVAGITDAHWRDYPRAKTVVQLNTGGTIRTWKNPMGIEHVFVGCPEGRCLYAGFVGWMHSLGLRQALIDIAQLYGVKG